jgi:hypothetical protein
VVGFLLILLTFLVIYPLLMLVFGALSDSNPVVDGFGKFRPSPHHLGSPFPGSSCAPIRRSSASSPAPV